MMAPVSAVLALLAALLSLPMHGVQAQASNSTVVATRTHHFIAKPTSVPLRQQLPPNENTTQLYSTWPRRQLRTDLPDSIAAVTVHDADILMGPPIHVQVGDRLNLKLTNNVPLTGLSIHLRGLGYGGAFEYAGAVGVSQCPLAEGASFTYDVTTVDDAPGTYWYHTASGHLGINNAYDAIRGPLIVHPPGSEALAVVDALNVSPLPSGYNPLAYENERILFFQDGSLSSGAFRYSQHVGNLLPPPSKGDDGTIVATSPWHFGTLNGKLRDVIHVAPNQKYLFRLINGGQHHPLRFSIDGFPLAVVAVDSQPVEAYSVDEVILHVGERFDVEVVVYNDIQLGETFWIRADTLESKAQGFQNGVRAILRVSDPQSIPLDEDVPDPSQSIAAPLTSHRNTKTLNCHSSGGCIPITFLSPLGINRAEANTAQSEIHFVDAQFQAAPQYGHFLSIDQSAWSQNELPPAAMISRTFRPEKSVHPNSMALRVSNASSAIIVWRSTMLMDVPMSVNGHTVDILDVALPDGRKDCNLVSCRLSTAYAAQAKLLALDKIPRARAIKKGTFVVPAGGAIVTRIHTGSESLWLATSQKDVHREDGLSFVLIVGDYSIPQVDNWPQDFPTCNSTLVKSTTIQPNCECRLDKGAPFQRGDPEKKYCSRAHLCRHELSQAANLERYLYDSGFNLQSGWIGFPDAFVAGIFFLVTLACVLLVCAFAPTSSYPADESESSKYDKVLRRLSSLGIGSRLPQGRRSNVVININSTGNTSSIPGLSLLSSEHIGTVEHIHEAEQAEEAEVEEEEDDDESVETILDADAPPPPPPSSSQSNNRRHLPPIPPTRPHPWRSNSLANSAGSLFVRKRRSTTSTFERIFSERGDGGKGGADDLKDAFDMLLDGYQLRGKVDIVPVDETVHRGSPHTAQLSYIFGSQLRAYFPTAVNFLRLVEVVGLAALTGAVFKSTNTGNSQATIAELSSLVLVLTTTWTFCRLFFAIYSQHDWFKSMQVVVKKKRFSLLPVFSARMTAVCLCECIWPTIATFVCFPVAGLVGDMRSLCNISFLLSSNNLCYIFLGMALGQLTSVPQAMIAATVLSQISIVVSGVFTVLPPSLEWARYFSPFYWTVQGLLKSVFRWSDTFECVVGSSSDVGADQCFIEYDGLIDLYKRRGLYDPSSDDVVAESITLVALSFGLCAVLFCRCFLTYYRVNWELLWDLWPETW